MVYEEKARYCWWGGGMSAICTAAPWSPYSGNQSFYSCKQRYSINRCPDVYVYCCTFRGEVDWQMVLFLFQLTMNDFSVHRIIGRGGFGEVYGCRKADTGKMWEPLWLSGCSVTPCIVIIIHHLSAMIVSAFIKFECTGWTLSQDRKHCHYYYYCARQHIC